MGFEEQEIFIMFIKPTNFARILSLYKCGKNGQVVDIEKFNSFHLLAKLLA
jgi:hypothetical protein